MVTLTWAELQHAAFVGCQRRLRAMSRGRQDRYGAPTNDLWGVDISAAAAELAVAKALNAYWGDSSLPDYDGDVSSYNVRSTARRDGRLILYPADSDESVFVLVCGSPPTFHLAGWILAREGKVEDHWQDDRTRVPCFMVPQDRLHPLSDLIYVAGLGNALRGAA